MTARSCTFKWKHEQRPMNETTQEQVLGGLQFARKDTALTGKQKVWCFSLGRAEEDGSGTNNKIPAWKLTPIICKSKMPAICEYKETH